MSTLPAGFGARDAIVAAFDLVQIATPDGPVRLMLGADGVFTDVDGNAWTGSSLIAASQLEAAIDGRAPSGELTLSYFQDPAAPDLVAQIRSLGADYVRGRALTFYVQPFRTLAEMQAPVFSPVPWLVRTMRTVKFSASGAQDRSISVTFEAQFEDRRSARRIAYNTRGHAALIGAANPSLEFIPTDNFEEEKLW